ncbi:SulP family inorganic anion transporter [Pseudomonas shirazica]|nr:MULTISPECIES: SulP family inorganic anion transporter [Pseudomonas]MDY4310263.1 SulP family inorganic anion transporter [Pseudomonas putida]AJG14110.1 SulP family inorganic anion transporter [Pseudomonas plecoglossicida]MBF8787790.1 STAS domain-containing protein [Pseudomonas asiatica]MDY4320091.1 SulP family inorganic anion transporter [Pseudomonas putida]MDY4352955.1 SulP family inorganic anion transporter [Pseudomonas putida]
MIAVREAWNAGLFKREHWMRNLVSGLIVGVVALPLAMAFAIASGVKPEQGIYTAIIGGLLVSLLGGSRLQIAGPTGAFIVILAGVTAKYGVEGLQLATMMAGAILLVLGITRLGAVIKFIPDPVIVGFTAGIGIIIWVGQWRDFFGLPEIEGGHFHEKLWHLLLALPDLHIATTLLATCSLALLILAPRLPVLKRLPGPLVAMVFATLVQSLFHFDGVATIGTAFGAIPQGLPSLTWPEVSLARVIELIGPAFAIAMLGAIESLLSAVVADGMAGTRHDSNQELIGQGVANLVVPLFGGFAATGAIARTATNIRNGATGPLAGIIHALTLVLIILFLAPLASNIPLCALAAILFVVAYNMSELKHFKRMLQRAPRADIAILLVTFTLTVFSDLVIAVNIGVILAMLQFMRRMASSVEVQQVVEEELANQLHSNGQKSLPPGVLVYTIEGPLFFGAAETFERALSQTHTDPELLVICLKRVPFMDITGLQTLEEVIQQLHERQIVVKLCEANGKVLGKLEKAGILRLLGPGHYHQTLGTALLEAKAPAAHN